MISKGTFDVTLNPEPSASAIEGVTIGRVAGTKRFSGPLEATSEMHMIAARTPVEGSASYAAVERVSGTLDGKRGTFIMVHVGQMHRGTRALFSVTIAPDSGTGELAGISGRMTIEIVNGKHFYELDYSIEN